MSKILLASKSPRRKMLLEQIRVDCEVVDGEIDESHNNGEEPLDYVRRMSIQKAEAGWNINQNNNQKQYPLLAADTSIAVDNIILGKAIDSDDAFRMLTKLSDKTHKVITCVTMIYQTKFDAPCELKVETIDSITEVRFMKLSASDINEYLATNEWKDKAGSYAIQGYAAKFISSIHGSYSGVVGLPLYETNKLIEKTNRV